MRLTAEGAVEVGERFRTFVDPGRPLAAVITRLTGIRDDDLLGAPSPDEAVRAFAAFVADGPGAPCFLGHNVGFDLAFLERAGLDAGAARLDTADLASIVVPEASSHALQRLAVDAGVTVAAAHRAEDDALTCAAVLGWLARRARALPPAVLEEARAHAALIGEPFAAFFADALRGVVRGAWLGGGLVPEPRPRSVPAPAGTIPSAAAALAPDGPLARALPGYEVRPEQRALAVAVEEVMKEGGTLLAEAGTGVGKSIAYLLPALARAAAGERVIVSTHTLPLQDQLVRKDLPSLQAALGTAVPIAVLKGRTNYLCPRRWQAFRTQAASRDEARLALKTLVWRTTTHTGDRAEINLLGGEGDLWSRISADDETCTARRCAALAGGCYLDRARRDAGEAGIVVVNHALLLQDARLGSGLLPDAAHVVVDEAHRLEDVAADAFGTRLEDWRLRRDLERVARQPAVAAALRDERAEQAETIRREIGAAHERAAEVFGALRAILAETGARRLRVTSGLRARDDVWLPVELAGERLADSLAAVRTAVERLVRASAADDDEAAELENAAGELGGARTAIARGIHAPQPGDVVWLAADPAAGGLTFQVAPSHVGTLVRKAIVDQHRSTTFTSATLAVAGDLAHAAERLGVSEVAGTLVLGSPFDFARQALLLVPPDIAQPHEDGFASDVARVVEDVARALGGRTLVLFTAHASLRDVAARLGALEEEGIAVLAQGDGGSRRALLDRFAQGGAVLLGTQSFWEGVDLPGDLLRCVLVVRLPFAVPDDPLVEGRAERYDDPFAEYHVPEAALRLRQGFGRLIRTATDRGVVVLLDRRVIERDYGRVFLDSLPPASLRRVPLERIGDAVGDWCAAPR